MLFLGRFAKRTTTLVAAINYSCPRCAQRPCNLFEICWTSHMVPLFRLGERQQKRFAIQCTSCGLEKEIDAAQAQRLSPR